MFMETLTSSRPSSFSLFRNWRALTITRSPMGMMSFVFSAMGMNSMGGTSPNLPVLSLARASKLRIEPVFRSMMGWYCRNRSSLE